MQMKTCVKCKNKLDLSHFNKQKSCKYGVTNICKECAKEISRKWREEKSKTDSNYIEDTKKYMKEYRENNKQKLYELGKKYREKFKDNIKQKKKEYYNKNFKKISEHGKSYRLKNKDQIKERDKKYYSSNKDVISKKYKEYYKNNKEIILKRNAKYQEKWNVSEHGRLLKLLQVHRRRSLINNLPSNFTENDWEKCKEYFKDKCGVLRCAYCNKPIKRATQEHFIPVSKGGGYTVDNIIPVCRHCNSSKINKNFKEWYVEQPFYCKERELKIYKYLDSRRDLLNEGRNVK